MCRKKCRLFLAAMAALGAVCTANAHPGSRIWIGSANNTIVTYGSDNDLAPSTYTPQRVFVGGLDEDTLQVNGLLEEFPQEGTGTYASEFPGYQVRLDGNSGIGTGSTFGFNFTGPLLVYDLATQAFKTAEFKFGTPGPAPRMAEVASSITLTGSGPVSGFNFFSYNTASDHAHLITTLYGDGQHAVDGPHVVYAVPMQLKGGGKKDSLPYYVLFGRDISVDQPEFQSALSVANLIFPRIPGDANLDGHVDSHDFDILASNYNGTGKKWQTGDFNFDDVTNALDFNAIATNYGATAPSAALGAMVPEPSMAMVIGGVALCVRRRKRSR